MDILDGYLDKIQDSKKRARMVELFQWVYDTFPNLEAVIKWNQPMFTDHGTFIIAFNMAKYHMSFSPEEAGVTMFLKDIEKSAYEHTKGIVKIKWTDEINYNLIKKIIEFNITDKSECTTFFRK